jgi:ribonuclease P protein component
MLPAGTRLRRSADFTATLRTARAARGDSLVVLHLAIGAVGRPAGEAAPAPAPSSAQPRIGFVVPRSVGPAVTRNRVRRRLRHLVRDRLDRIPAGARLVVRVLPPAAAAPSTELGSALDRALASALDRAGDDRRTAARS